MLAHDSLTTDQKGAIAEAKIAVAAIELGVGVSKPMSPLRYDLVFDLPTGLARIQCKWASRRGDVVIVRCRTSRRSRTGFIRTDYMPEEVEMIAVYCGDLDRCYLFPIDRFPGRSAIQLRLHPARNNQKALVNWASEYDFVATLTALVGP